VNGKLIARIEREFDSYEDIIVDKFSIGAITSVRYLKFMKKLEEWRDRFDDLIFAEVSE
jgi:hypothetical protein